MSILLKDEILRERMNPFTYPLPPVTYEDDAYIMRATERFIAEVIEPTKEAAIVDAVKRWAEGKGYVTLIQIPEEHLLEILRVGAQVVRNNELAKEVTDEIISECESRKGE